jgi:hypothetical protein
MPYTAQQLITNSWYLSGIVARNLQVPTGDQIGDGLDMLNDLLNFKQIETDLIPYWQYITFPAIPGQEYYFLPGVAAVEEMTFNLGVVRYPMVGVTRTNYYGSSRVDNISTLPFSWNYDRSLGGGNLAMYFIPDQPYPMKMKAKLFFTDVSLNTDLTDITTLNGVVENFTANQLTTTFTVTSGTGGALVINSNQPIAFGEQVEFTGGSIPSTLSLSTIYYAVPINGATFYVATTLTNAQQGVYVAYAAGSGSVVSEALVITLATPTPMYIGSELIFTQGTGTLPPGITAGVVYYANPSSASTLCVCTSLLKAQDGDNILYEGAGTPTNTLTFINPENTPYFTNYTFINSPNQGYDTSYIEMLRYALARYMCSEYGIVFNPQSEAIYQSYVRKLMYISPPDLSMKKVTILSASDQVGYNWGDVNIGRGWRPS